MEALTSRRVFLKTLGVLVAGAAFITAARPRTTHLADAQTISTPAAAPHENADTWLFKFGADGAAIFSYMPGRQVDNALHRGWNIAPAEVADVRVRQCVREAIGNSVDVEGIATRCAVKFARIDVQQYEP